MIAPAGVPDAVALERGLSLLSERYTVRTYRDLDNPHGMCAGDDQLRAQELRWALTDPDITCLIAARGGYGTARILTKEISDLIARSQRLMVGFSDITALLATAVRCGGLRGIHGPMVCQVGRRGKAWPAFERLISMMEDPSPRAPIESLSPIVPGQARGTLIGGNLTVLTHLVGTPFMPNLDGAVLFLEDVGERPYRLDRCLTQLSHARLLDHVLGVVIGDLTDCDPKGLEYSARRIIEDFCHTLGVPAAADLPVGHGRDNEPLPYGAQVALDAAKGILTFLEGAVSGGGLPFNAPAHQGGGGA